LKQGSAVGIDEQGTDGPDFGLVFECVGECFDVSHAEDTGSRDRMNSTAASAAACANVEGIGAAEIAGKVSRAPLSTTMMAGAPVPRRGSGRGYQADPASR
jgi:hypothetical protein